MTTVAEKLESLRYCLENEAREDAAAHLCDLLEYCRVRIVTSDRMIFKDLEGMVKKYGKNPEELK